MIFPIPLYFAAFLIHLELFLFSRKHFLNRSSNIQEKKWLKAAENQKHIRRAKLEIKKKGECQLDKNSKCRCAENREHPMLIFKLFHSFTRNFQT